MENNTKNSIGMFDISRGILMIAVVLGHSITAYIKYWEPEFTMHWWYCFLIIFKPVIYGVIPMFYMMSGYGFRKKRIGKNVRDNIHYLLKPYLITGLVVTAAGIVRTMIEHQSVKECVWYRTVPFLLGLCPGENWLAGHYVGSIGPIWFLVVLALSGFALNLIFRLDQEWMRAVCVMVLVAVCTRLPFISLIPFCIIQALCCSGYLYIGYQLRTHNLLYQPLGRKNLIVLIVLSFAVMIPGNIEVSQNVWALGTLDYIASAITGFLLLKLCMYLNAERFKGRVTKGLRVIDRYSLYILCVHTMEYLAFPWDKVQNLFGENKVLGIVVTFAGRCLIIALGSMLMQRCMEKRRRRKR